MGPRPAAYQLKDGRRTGRCDVLDFNATGNHVMKSLAHDPLPSSTNRKTPVVRWIIGITLAVCVSSTAIYIEALNAEAGGFLPRTLPKYGNAKWRFCWWETEARWREILGPKDEQGKPVTRRLTNAEQEKMHKDIAHAKAMNQLRGAVENLGLLNYLLVPALIGVAASLHGASLRSKGKNAALALIGIALVAGGLALYRGYFTSIGY